MGLTKTMLNIGKELTEANRFADGGYSSLLVRRKFNAKGKAAIIGGIGLVAATDEGVKGHSRAKVGKVSYHGGMQRMTGAFTTGAVEAAHKASDGDYAVFSDMMEETVRNGSLVGAINDHGANAEFISALYGMGGN